MIKKFLVRWGYPSPLFDKRVNYALIALMVVIGLCFYPFLPQNMPMQFNGNHVKYTLPKQIGILAIPIFAVLTNLFSVKWERYKTASNLLLIVIILAAYTFILIR